MKLQLTALAAAITLSFSAASWANQAPDYEHNGVSRPGGQGEFGQQETIRNGMNGFTSFGDGTTGARQSDIEQIYQTGSTANVWQSGTEQYSDILQQGANGGGEGGNEAYVRQGGELNESRIRQINGSDNYAKVDQDGQQDRSFIQQYNGDDNEAYVEQNGEQNESVIWQNGNENYAKVEQKNSTLSDSYIEQVGSYNEAKVTQLNNSDLSDSIIRQTGTDNTAYVDQQLNSRETWSFIEQRGEDHLAEVTQRNADLSASYIIQVGYNGVGQGHEATVTQTNEEASLSMIRQRGSKAIANHTQTGGTGNVASTYQW